MAESSRFTVAVHVLALLAYEQGKALTSDYIAGSVNTNPVVIRRALALLKKAGLVCSTEGAGGGTTLARSAERITMADVFKAVEPNGDFFGSPRADPNPLCPVGRSVQGIVRQHGVKFERTVEREMKQVTLADVLRDVRAGK